MIIKHRSKIFILVTALVALPLATWAQETTWSLLNELPRGVVRDKTVERRSFPTEFKLFYLNSQPLRQSLFLIVDSRSAARSTVISLPNADGRIEQFEIFEASNFEPELQARFPEIRAFSGRGLTDPYATLKLSYSPQGIHGTVFRVAKGVLHDGGETEIIEPYSSDNQIYAVFRSQRNRAGMPWACSTAEKSMFSEWSSRIKEAQIPESNDGKIRVLRLAQSCNGEYSNFFNADNPSEVSLVLAAFNNTFTRANGVYEKDLGIHLDMIAQSTALIFYNPATDPYSEDLGNWNDELRTAIIGAGITTNDYDIGHMFGSEGGGGNAGCIGCICSTGAGDAGHEKGRGITSPADGNPQGDNFDIDFVVHEVGHQLGANHTFSFGSLPVPEMYGQDKEVGSGITIMGYAGITEFDVAPHSIDSFHETSIGQVQANMPTRPCPASSVITMTANNRPVVARVSNYTIPILTPFALTGSATDPEGDPITYNWEQDDSAENSGVLGATGAANHAKLIGPNWRSFASTTSPTKLFPNLSTILAGQLKTTAAGTDDIAPIDVEALSAITRDLRFRLTVRDNRPYVPNSTIGQTQFTDMTVSVTSLSGPFKVTAPNSNVGLMGGALSTVTWDVLNTNLPPVSAANVKISMSVDGGLTFPHVLAASTPNDGTQSVLIPNVGTTTARMKVEAVGNIFFDISDTNFTVFPPTAAQAAISGRITDDTGHGVRQVVVTLTSHDGTVRTATTNSFGYFSFAQLETGGVYIIEPRNRRYAFTPERRAYMHADEVSNLDFVAETR